MSLNIKNVRVHELAREAARLTGKSQTAVIGDALEELIARLSAGDEWEVRRRRLEAVFAEIDRNPPTDEDRAAMQKVMDEMYDEDGLPA